MIWNVSQFFRFRYEFSFCVRKSLNYREFRCWINFLRCCLFLGWEATKIALSGGRVAWLEGDDLELGRVDATDGSVWILCCVIEDGFWGKSFENSRIMCLLLSG